MCDPSHGRTVGTSEYLWTVMSIQVYLPKKPSMLLTLTSSEHCTGMLGHCGSGRTFGRKQGRAGELVLTWRLLCLCKQHNRGGPRTTAGCPCLLRSCSLHLIQQFLLGLEGWKEMRQMAIPYLCVNLARGFPQQEVRMGWKQPGNFILLSPCLTHPIHMGHYLQQSYITGKCWWAHLALWLCHPHWALGDLTKTS